MNILIPILLILSVEGIRRYLSYYKAYSDSEKKEYAFKLFLLISSTTYIIVRSIN